MASLLFLLDNTHLLPVRIEAVFSCAKALTLHVHKTKYIEHAFSYTSDPSSSHLRTCACIHRRAETRVRLQEEEKEVGAEMGVQGHSQLKRTRAPGWTGSGAGWTLDQWWLYEFFG